MADLKELRESGVSAWLDSLSRKMLDDGSLQKWIDNGLLGLTSNPSIFESSIRDGSEYLEDIQALVKAGSSAEEIAWDLMVKDVQRACDLFLPVYERTQGEDGYVSLELDPRMAYNTQGSIDQGDKLWKRVDRKNLMLKVPGTEEGLPVISDFIAKGYNVNVTLLFSVERYAQVLEAHKVGIEQGLSKGQDMSQVHSVASFFVSRVDAAVDPILIERGKKEEIGKSGLVNARRAFGLAQLFYGEDEWSKLEGAGANPQRPLWASTSTKNETFSPTLYVDNLTGGYSVNTIPMGTLEQFLETGRILGGLDSASLLEAEDVWTTLTKEWGVPLEEICSEQLEAEGVKKFEKAYKQLLQAVEDKME